MKGNKKRKKKEMSTSYKKLKKIRIHVLNLIDRDDKLLIAINELEKFKKVNKFLDTCSIEIVLHRQNKRKDGDGKRGCYWGHHSIWKQIAEYNDGESTLDIVCEDDILLNADTKKLSQSLVDIHKNRNHWDICCLGWFPLITKPFKDNPKFKRIKLGGMAHCYAVNSSWCKSHLNMSYPGYNHDLFIFRDEKDGWSVLGLTEMVAFQRDWLIGNDSSFNNEIEKCKEDKILGNESDISKSMYKTRQTWFKLFDMPQTMKLSENWIKVSHYFFIFVMLIVVIMFLSYSGKRYRARCCSTGFHIK